MAKKGEGLQGPVFAPLTMERWSDFEALFGDRGACGGCWCMWWRLPRSRFDAQRGEKNRQEMRRIVASGEVPGILAYIRGKPAAWCALAPREKYPGLESSRVLKRIDGKPVWSIVCFFVAKPFRRLGLTKRLLSAAAAHARKGGARILEGYPLDPRSGPLPDAFAWHGLVSAFRKAHFKEVARRSATRPVMRRTLRPASMKRSAGKSRDKRQGKTEGRSVDE